MKIFRYQDCYQLVTVVSAASISAPTIWRSGALACVSKIRKMQKAHSSDQCCQEIMKNNRKRALVGAEQEQSKKRRFQQRADVPTVAQEAQNAKNILIPFGGLAPIQSKTFTIKVTLKFKNKTLDKGSLEVVIPKILDKQTDKIFSIVEQEEHLTAGWIEFAREYLATIAENWNKVEDVVEWVVNIWEDTFSYALNLLWIRAKKEERFWRIAKSKVDIDREFWQGADSAGSGLFCTRAGKHVIHFGMMSESHWIDRVPIKGSKEESYAIGPTECEGDTKGKKVRYFIPTDLSMKSGLISCGFKVNCQDSRCINNNPTHELVFRNEKYSLQPRREAKENEEIT